MDTKQIAFKLFKIYDNLMITLHNKNIVECDKLIIQFRDITIPLCDIQYINNYEIRALIHYVDQFILNFLKMPVHMYRLFYMIIPDFYTFTSQNSLESNRSQNIINGWMYEYDFEMI